MAKAALSGIDTRTASQLAGLLASEGHEVLREKPDVSVGELADADIVFLGGSRDRRLTLLRRLRGIDPLLPVVVVAESPDTSEWLDALDAGATDYCVPPFYLKQIRLLVPRESPRLVAVAAGGR